MAEGHERRTWHYRKKHDLGDDWASKEQESNQYEMSLQVETEARWINWKTQIKVSS